MGWCSFSSDIMTGDGSVLELYRYERVQVLKNGPMQDFVLNRQTAVGVSSRNSENAAEHVGLLVENLYYFVH